MNQICSPLLLLEISTVFYKVKAKSSDIGHNDYQVCPISTEIPDMQLLKLKWQTEL